MARSAAQSGLLLLVLGAAAWQFFLPGFVTGGAAPANRSALTQRQGWRLDKIEVGLGGIGQLVTAEGFFIGEKDLFKIQNKMGRRYRMRPTKAELENDAGSSVTPPLLEIPIPFFGSLKYRVGEAFGGTGSATGLVKPEGYRGIAGVSGWDTLGEGAFSDSVPMLGEGYAR